MDGFGEWAGYKIAWDFLGVLLMLGGGLAWVAWTALGDAIRDWREKRTRR